VGVDALWQVPAQSAVRVRRGRDPLGAKRIERQATAMRSLHRLRPQGRSDPASKLGRHQHELWAVPDLSSKTFSSIAFAVAIKGKLLRLTDRLQVLAVVICTTDSFLWL
jgi:hypothetical protein